MNNIFRNLIIGASIVVGMTSCEDFLDVKPKTEIEASDLFVREQGFQDALWGVYTQMNSTALYGREMTYGMVDVLGQIYTNVGSGTYSYLKNYNYANASAEAMINSAWSNAYTAIANINNLISNIEKADKNMFAQNHYNVILGEAYGLRAFLHFDMLRLFAPSYSVAPDAAAIPYVKEYGFNVTPQSSVSETIDLVLADLNTASELLKASDPIVTGATVMADDALLTNRTCHFNYYAAIAEKARVYLYKNDLANAALAAKEVIGSGKFKWTSIDAIATNATNRDRNFSSEQVFALHTQDMEKNIEVYLTETKYQGNQLTLTHRTEYLSYGSSYDMVGYRYTDASDWRLLYQWSDPVAGTSYNNCFNTKLWQLEGMPTASEKRMPIIRLPELYLILAEAEGDKGAASLQTVREHRGITTPVAVSDIAALRSEILLEYVREFVCEGVMFYQYKRLNSTTMNGLRGNFNPDYYVLPMSKEEVEFGNRN